MYTTVFHLLEKVKTNNIPNNKNNNQYTIFNIFYIILNVRLSVKNVIEELCKVPMSKKNTFNK